MGDIFSRILRGEIPCTKIYEDDKTFAFLDIAPVNRGHTLVLPKKKAEKLHQLDEEYAAALMHAVQKIAMAIVHAYGPDYNIVVNNGEYAGQVVPYVHVHIIPRQPNDGVRIKWPGGRYSGNEAQEAAEKIKAHLH